ncbi:pre-mRNA-splicing factor 38B-like isoform X2 [Anopheles albimanus]|uniref:pre-mRNA-splicing factor 38B-like isoform X2 n=1 Tax=Anopheles albimanus TaxID=7167 RepID=UPI0016413949|nr:pre-mRNA-splicing factor 38B-like isoform X2 [Anopheles albimanus]
MEHTNVGYGPQDDLQQGHPTPLPLNKRSSKQNNALPFWGNETSMNLNPLILANIQGSSYFKVSLFKLKTYHEVVDEIYYQVKHLEPWERGSRKTAGQTGMCGGVRGVGAGGIVSTAFCLLYKLYTLRLTRKQVNGLLTHGDSPYIRALGFMYLRYTQPPTDLFDWYEPYLIDDEEIDVKAGGGQTMTIGQMIRQWLTKLDWFSTLFPRIPVPIQKLIDAKLEKYASENGISFVDTYLDRGSNSGKQVRSGATSVSQPINDRESNRFDRGTSNDPIFKDKVKRNSYSHCDREERSSRYHREDEEFLNRDRREFNQSYRHTRERNERDQFRQERHRHWNRDCVRVQDRNRDRLRDRDTDRKEKSRSGRISRSRSRDDYRKRREQSERDRRHR